MKPLLVLLAGIAVGGASGYIAKQYGAPIEVATDDHIETAFVEVDDIVAPLVLPDGKRLAGYVSFKLALEVPLEESEEITSRLPLLLHEINMRTYRKPMASGPDGTLPTLEVFRAVVEESSNVVFGQGAVRTIAIARATPA
ncbi:hypothetical protein DVR09_14730 (plasmid) [Erythrobacter aureus]|uniref:Flagellar basal body-associated protein FliL n=1 Tax=Erythrobacter aureus TaxID=2182384 RepID=A0A345YJQ0_9SPHN|nr:hypothetical protein DVR09_14730 [Erythrobacter aureus]